MFLLWVLGKRKGTTFVHQWFQSYNENSTRGNCDTFCVSRLGKEERSKSFPSLVTRLIPSIGLNFISLPLAIAFVGICTRWVNFCCYIRCASLVCIFFPIMDCTKVEDGVVVACSDVLCTAHYCSGCEGIQCAPKSLYAGKTSISQHRYHQSKRHVNCSSFLNNCVDSFFLKE